MASDAASSSRPAQGVRDNMCTERALAKYLRVRAQRSLGPKKSRPGIEGMHLLAAKAQERLETNTHIEPSG